MLDVAKAYDLDFVFPARDAVIGKSLRDFGEFARPELDALEALLRTGPGAYVDVGANIGAFAVPIAARNPERRVVAIEANRRVANLLAANAVANRLGNLEVIHAAAGANAGVAGFPVPALDTAMNFGAVGFGLEGSEMENVRVCTLDEVAPADARVVKLDVEGFEADVLAGARQVLLKTRPAWMFEWKPGQASQAVMTTFREAGYALFWFYSPFVTPRAAGVKAEKFPGDTNVMALPVGFPRPQNVPEVTDPTQRPGNSGAYGYLKGYGF
ncbi:MAG: SAM-dependent methyltransferase [Phenylobacterium sp.]|nr:SAM-dependent methyltransferase [Phenylobacterium sp.]